MELISDIKDCGDYLIESTSQIEKNSLRTKKNAVLETRPILVFPGLFQPLHLATEKILRYVLEQFSSYQIIIGILNPNPRLLCDSATWIRYSPERNPFSYWDRVEFLRRTFEKEILSGRIQAIIPLPRLTVNIEEAKNYLPPKPRKIVFINKEENEVDQWERDQYLKNGEELLEIHPNILPNHLRGISETLILALMTLKRNEWERLVPRSVSEIVNQRTQLILSSPENSRRYIRASLATQTFVSHMWNVFKLPDMQSLYS